MKKTNELTKKLVENIGATIKMEVDGELDSVHGTLHDGNRHPPNPSIDKSQILQSQRRIEALYRKTLEEGDDFVDHVEEGMRSRMTAETQAEEDRGR